MQKVEGDRLYNQRGSTTTEFVMVLPLLVVAMLFLLGLGYTLMTKQNAIVGARAAVFYRASLEETPRQVDMNAVIKNAVSPDREEWILDFNQANMENPPSDNAGVFLGAVNGIYQSFNKEINYTASGTATLGFVPRIMTLGRAQSTYYLPHRTWTCAQTGGSYTTVAIGAIGLPSPLPGWFDTSCCESYDAHNQ
jgi:hypothetical protein